MSVHVSIHDVSPAWEKEIEVALNLCAGFGVKPALLVVPNFHGEWPLPEHPGYVDRLRALQQNGHEIYLHGFLHQARARGSADAGDGGRPGGIRWAFAQRVVSAGEAEFSDLTPRETRQRLEEGDRLLRRGGLVPSGFVPPAWSMPVWVRTILAELGYRYTEDHLRVYDPVLGTTRYSVVLNFASRTRLRKLTSVAWCRLARVGKGLLPARIAIHPGDMRSAWLRAETLKLLEWGQGDWVSLGQELLR